MDINKIYNGDCLDYMKTIPDGFFDLAVCDPPYGGANSEIGGGNRFGEIFDRYKKPNYETMHTRGGGWASKYQDNNEKGKIEWDVAPPQEFFDELFRVSKDQIIWGGNYFSLPPTRCFLVWKKLTISETFSMAMAEYAWTSFKGNAKLFECAPQGNREKRFHPTQKPVELYAWIYRMFAKEGMKVFDPMMGSQSSRIAAYFAKLDYFWCELDRDYFAMGNERFERVCEGVERENGIRIEQMKLF